jgi:hypothetical protein
MVRRILGFALFAVVVWLALKIVLGILGTLFGLAITVLVLAGVGYVLYVVLRVVSPNTAAKLRAAIRGEPAKTTL